MNLPSVSVPNLILAFVIILIFLVVAAFVPFVAFAVQLVVWTYVLALVLDRYRT